MKNDVIILFKTPLIFIILCLGTISIVWAQSDSNKSHVGKGQIEKSLFYDNRSTPANLISIGPRVQVSKANDNLQHDETVVAIDPNDASHLVTSAMVFDPVKSRYYVIVYISSDGGTNWEPTLTVRRGRLTGDPTVAFGTKSQVYFTCLGFPIKEGKPGGVTLVYRSRDGGKHWDKPTKLPMSDRPFMAVDHTHGKYRGRLYLPMFGGPGLPNQQYQPFDASNSDIGRSLAVYHSSNGEDFPNPVYLVFREKQPLRRAGNVVVLSDGTLMGVVAVGNSQAHIVAKASKANEKNLVLKTYTSSNGGKTFSRAHTVHHWHYPTDIGVAGTNPAIAVDKSHGPFRGRVYVVWADKRSSRTTILLAYSDNKGQSWSSPVMVDHSVSRKSDNEHITKTNKNPDNFQPMVAVNKKGVVGVVWYDRRDHPNNANWSEYFAASLDGGDTFPVNKRISKHPFEHNWNRSRALNTNVQLGMTTGKSGVLAIRLSSGRASQGAGETQGLAASADGVFHPVWISTRTGIAQAWTAGVTVHDHAMKNGSKALKGLTDITRKVAVDLSHPKYDAGNHVISVQAQLVNKSSSVFKSPIKVRAMSLGSHLGTIRIANADNGGTEPNSRGGVGWNFTPQIPKGGWKPGAKLAPRRLEFRVGKKFSDIKTKERLQFLHLTARVYARKP